MKHPIFTGSGVAIVTPFFNGLVDWKAFRELIDFQIDAGTDAIIVCGTTGEASTMTYGEKMQVIEVCVQHVAGRVPVIAGTGSNSTETAVIASKDAQRAGVDGLLVVTPYYNKATQEGLVRHYSAIADAVSSPVILYNVPSRTGVSIAPETYAELAKHPNIHGVKEASGNFSAIQLTRLLCPEDFYIWAGNDDETASICLLGGVGVISVAANILPTHMHYLTELCAQNNFAAAGELQLQLKPVFDTLFCEVNPIPVKTALHLMGKCSGDLRLPLCPPSEEHANRIRQVLKDFSLLPR